MTIESRELFELCKKCYEATGWDDTKDGFFDGGEIMPFTDRIGAYIGASNFRCPLYTSDYLLEKLPKYLVDDEHEVHTITLYCGKWSKQWLAGYDGYFGGKNDPSGTPLKALLKLTLKLHEDEIL